MLLGPTLLSVCHTPHVAMTMMKDKYRQSLFDMYATCSCSPSAQSQLPISELADPGTVLCPALPILAHLGQALALVLEGQGSLGHALRPVPQRAQDSRPSE